MTTPTEIFDKARTKLGQEEFYFFLCFVYGVTSSSMTKEDLRIIEKSLNERIGETKT